MDQLTASAPTRSAAAARRRLARARRRVAAGVAALLSTIGILATVTPLAQAANNCGEGVVTCGTVDKEVVNPKPVYQVGESVTYRLTLQCSSCLLYTSPSPRD